MKNDIVCDIVVDLAYGDSGKGKVVHHLLKNGNYTHCVRGSGGMNCGHSIYHNGKKIITHSIPAGVFFGVKSIIGPGCVVHYQSFEKELQYLEENGIEARKLVKVARNAHVITDEHLEEDMVDTRIGTTKRGNGPAYRDKYARVGKRVEDDWFFKPYVVDFYDEISDGATILYEGAQGFGLDIDHGDYPYVTSGHCTVAGALLNGIPHTAVRNVYGVIKAYTTYVGSKKFQPDDKVFDRLRELGGEYGATTGRPRQCNWNNEKDIIKAAKINGITHLVVNKMDILQKLGIYGVIGEYGNVKKFNFFLDFVHYMEDFAWDCGVRDGNLFLSYSPERI